MANVASCCPDGRMHVSDKVSPATGSSVTGAAGRGSEADSGGDRPAAAGPASDPAPGPGGSLASVLETLRDAASVHDGRAEPTQLPDTGPLPGEGEHRA